jgi:tetratricopeptide (TPR) repeat protein
LRAWLGTRRGKAAAALAVGIVAFAGTALFIGVRRVPEGSVGIRRADGAPLEAGRTYFSLRDAAVTLMPVALDLRGVSVPFETAGGERLRATLALRGTLAIEAARALASGEEEQPPPEDKVRSAVAQAVGRALALREGREMIEASPFPLKTPWLGIAGVERGLEIESSEVDLVTVESLRQAAARLQAGPDPAAALRFLQALAERRPSDPAPVCVLGDLARLAGDWGRAEGLYLQALELDPTLHAALEVLSVRAQQTGEDVERVERLLRRALQSRPESIAFLNWLSLVLARREDFQGAEGALVRALAISPGDAATAINLAALKDRQGRRKEAIDLLRRLLEHQPDNALALFNLGSALAEEGDLPGALAALEHAERITPPSVRLYSRLAAVHEKNGDAQRAAAYREKAEETRRRRAGQAADEPR